MTIKSLRFSRISLAVLAAYGLLDSTHSGDDHMSKLVDTAHLRGHSKFVAVTVALIALMLAGSAVNGAVGPNLVKDINTSGDSDPESFAKLGSLVLFRAADSSHGQELFRTNGTNAGTKLVKDINPSGDSDPSGFRKLGSFLYFAADDGSHGRELWRTDGTAAGTRMVKDINTNGAHGSEPEEMTLVGGVLLFYASDAAHGREIWRTGGTAKTTKLLKDINPSGDSDNCCFDMLGGVALFSAFNGSDYDLWRTTGTTASTTIVQGLGDSPTGREIVVGSRFFFSIADVSTDHLWVSDGTAAHTDEIAELEEVNYVAALGSGLFFEGNDGDSGREPWFSDGTTLGTNRLADVMPGSGGAGARPWTDGSVNGLIFFQSDDGTHGSELWKTNGTPAGTRIVEDINPVGDSSDGADFREVIGNKLYFIADDGTHGFEPWITDGTANGTRLLKDIVSGGGTSDSSDGEVINGVLYFTAVRSTTGREIWRTNGTPIGTKRLADINPGPPGSGPELAATGGTLWIGADDGTHGKELFKFVP